MRLAVFASLAGTAFACLPPYDPDYYRNHLPLVPCWQEQDSMCRPYIDRNTEMLVFPESNFVVVLPISNDCANTIAEEKARELDGRKTYGWREKHGQLDVLRDTLIISNMTDAVVQEYLNLEYQDPL